MLLVTQVADAPIKRLLGIEATPETQAITFSVKDMIGLSVGLLSAVAIVALTKCRRTDTAMNIFWSQCLFGLAFALWPTAHAWVRPTGGEVGMLLLIAFLSIAGQLAMTSAYKYTGATYGSLLGFFSVILTTIIALVVFGEELSSRFWIGAALILVPCVYLSVSPVRRRSAPSAESR
jgi:drug/metabolite transporter (DMT)-like permease